MIWQCNSVVEYLLSKHEVLDLIPSITKTNAQLLGENGVRTGKIFEDIVLSTDYVGCDTK